MNCNSGGKFRKKRVNFSMVSNDIIRNDGVSLKAKGLYALIQSYITIDNFTLYKGFLQSKCVEGALADRVRELKETEKGVEHMCKEMEELYDEARMDEKKENARSMAEDGMAVDRIAKILKVNVKMVQEWLAGSVSAVR